MGEGCGEVGGRSKAKIGLGAGVHCGRRWAPGSQSVCNYRVNWAGWENGEILPNHIYIS